MTEVYFYLQIIIINKNYNLCSFLILKNIYSGNGKNSLLIIHFSKICNKIDFFLKIKIKYEILI